MNGKLVPGFVEGLPEFVQAGIPSGQVLSSRFN
jgi:hypothetical protein